MDFRRSLSVVLLTAVCALAAGAVNAQSVFVSPNNQPPRTSTPTAPAVPSTGQSTGQTAGTPSGGTQGYVRPTTPTIQPQIPSGAAAATGNQARSPIDLPDERPDEDADFASRHLGIEDQTSASRRALLSYSPEQIQAARQAFDAMAKNNPAMAANNPIGMLELMARSQRRENALSDKINAACVAGTIKIMISQTTFNGKPAAEANLDKNAMAPLAAVFTDLCSDPMMRDLVAKNVHMITIVNTANAPKGEVIADSGVVTLRDDFTRAEGMPTAQIRSAIKDELTKITQLNQRRPAEDPRGGRTR